MTYVTPKLTLIGTTSAIVLGAPVNSGPDKVTSDNFRDEAVGTEW
jgi:hypothetical protein